MMTFAEKIKFLRKEKKISQSDLARSTGIAPQHISGYENGRGMPSTENLIKLAKEFDVSIDYLLKEHAPRAGWGCIQDQELLEYLEQVDRLDEDDRLAIKKIIEAMVMKEKVVSAVAKA